MYLIFVFGFFFFRISIKKDDTASYLQTLDAIFNEINPSLIVVMMAKNRVNTYQSIKNKLCVDLGGNNH